jgi:hypothetical protein
MKIMKILKNGRNGMEALERASTPKAGARYQAALRPIFSGFFILDQHHFKCRASPKHPGIPGTEIFKSRPASADN